MNTYGTSKDAKWDQINPIVNDQDSRGSPNTHLGLKPTWYQSEPSGLETSPKKKHGILKRLQKAAEAIKNLRYEETIN